MTAATLPDNGGYVAAAYLILTLLLLIYFAIMAFRLSKLQREVDALGERLDERDETRAAATSEEAIR